MLVLYTSSRGHSVAQVLAGDRKSCSIYISELCIFLTMKLSFQSCREALLLANVTFGTSLPLPWYYIL